MEILAGRAPGKEDAHALYSTRGGVCSMVFPPADGVGVEEQDRSADSLLEHAVMQAARGLTFRGVFVGKGCGTFLERELSSSPETK